jgi:amino acid adenylation domain-containing protein
MHPERLAVQTGSASWTYAELDVARRKVARALASLRSEPGSRVALLLDHDAPMLAGVLGTLSSGCAYVPLDPAHPIERLRQIVADASPVALVASTRNLPRASELLERGVPVLEIDALLRGPDAPEPDAYPTPDALAYVLYTSGSTGRPKGVAQNHRNVLHHIAAYTNGLHLRELDKLTLLPSYCVDAAVMDVFAALLNGATLCPIDVRETGFRAVVDRLDELGVTVYHSTPTLFRQIVRELAERGAPATVRLVVLGGEEVRRSDAEVHRARFGPACILVNGFGPTESTVSLQYFVDGATPLDRRTVPIGRPVESTEISLLSRGGVPGQVYGEIAVRSPHVALGYWRSPETTEAAFGGEATGAARVYRTGDMARLLPDGTLEYRGRRDSQTKILGFRVELGEIEAALGLHPGVKEAAAVVQEDDDGDKRVVAYYSAHAGQAPSQDELRRHLRGKLPIHMVPARLVHLDRLTWTTSGKLDRRALPAPDEPPPCTSAEPEDDLQRRLAAIWAKALGVERVGLDDDFFDLGGHSMSALRMVTRIDADLGVNLTLGTLFEAPTLRRLTEVVRSELPATPPAPTPRPARALSRLLQRLHLTPARARPPR